MPHVEFNISCPNVDEHPSLPDKSIIRRILVNAPAAIFKLPPVPGVVATACRLAEYGVKYIHLSNTIPSPIGGISGAPLRELNLPFVESVAEVIPEVEIIAGGGIYSSTHVDQYKNAGATRFSLGTAWFWPPRAKRVIKQEQQARREAGGGQRGTRENLAGKPLAD